MTNDILNNIWPEWQIVRRIGSGSFGVVYEAIRQEHHVESRAAVKVISIPQNVSEIDSLRSEGLTLDATRTYLQGVVNDFVSEIQLMESLKGVQNIVNVEDYKVIEKTNEIGWDIYIRMELLTPLNSYISGRILNEQEVIKLGCDICTALEFCAKRNIIHRDIKPENIFVNDFGDFKLGDFGIARKLENVTGGLSQKGTYNYMAPEIERGKDYNATVDVYSLGLVLYRFLNKNRLPFLNTEKQLMNPNERMAAIRRRMNGERLPAPCDASPHMAQIILCACEFDPNKRFASATAMKNALSSNRNGGFEGNSNNLSKTVALFEESQNNSRTTAVRRASEADYTTQNEVGSFGPKRKFKVLKIIASVFAGVLLIGISAFVTIKIMNHKLGTENTNSSHVESKKDEEQIEKMIEEADVLAASKDYEGALKKIETGLIDYPKSKFLQEKSKEYTAAFHAQIKETALTEADAFAESGNYVAAIQTIHSAISVIGEDAELTKKKQTYEGTYVANVIAQSNGLVNEGRYSEAMSIVDEAVKNIPENVELAEQKKAILDAKPKKFMDVCPPYEKDRKVTLYTEGKTFSMSGEQYRDGITMQIDSFGTWFLSNLKKEYTEIQFYLGHKDESGMADATLSVYLDDVLYKTYEVPSSGLPQLIKIPVSGVNQLKIMAAYKEYNGFPEIGLGNMTIR